VSCDLRLRSLSRCIWRLGKERGGPKTLKGSRETIRLRKIMAGKNIKGRRERIARRSEVNLLKKTWHRKQVGLEKNCTQDRAINQTPSSKAKARKLTLTASELKTTQRRNKEGENGGGFIRREGVPDSAGGAWARMHSLARNPHRTPKKFAQKKEMTRRPPCQLSLRLGGKT